MTAQWNGKTPYVIPVSDHTATFLDPDKLAAYQQSFRDRAEGFADAMNSETVRGLYGAVKMQHQAIDILFARLISLDHTFRPSQSGLAWQAAREGNAAIVAFEKDLVPKQETAP